jgi:digeranylgeranylglycerophospholipid reductase
MSEAVRAQVLVIGLGPAGASAALAASSCGLRVLAVERKSAIGVPIQCAEYIPLTIARHARPEGVRQQAVTAMKSWLNQCETFTTDVPGLMIDRSRFDQALASAARQAGAEIRTSTRLVALAPQQRQASLACGPRHYTVHYDYLIAADGPRSMVAKALGLPPLESIYSYQITIPLLQSMHDTEVWHDARFPGGYAWLFPRGGEANLGAAGYGEEAGRLKSGLQELHRQLAQEGRVGTAIIRATGGPIPVSGMRQPLVFGVHVFVGDAAGLCHPITGAGIATAVDSGSAAGQAVAAACLGQEPDALHEYQTEMLERYGPSLEHACARRRWLQQQWRDGRYDEIATLRQGWIACPEYFERKDDVGS